MHILQFIIRKSVFISFALPIFLITVVYSSVEIDSVCLKVVKDENVQKEGDPYQLTVIFDATQLSIQSMSKESQYKNFLSYTENPLEDLERTIKYCKSAGQIISPELFEIYIDARLYVNRGVLLNSKYVYWEIGGDGVSGIIDCKIKIPNFGHKFSEKKVLIVEHVVALTAWKSSLDDQHRLGALNYHEDLSKSKNLVYLVKIKNINNSSPDLTFFCYVSEIDDVEDDIPQIVCCYINGQSNMGFVMEKGYKRESDDLKFRYIYELLREDSEFNDKWMNQVEPLMKAICYPSEAANIDDGSLNPHMDSDFMRATNNDNKIDSCGNKKDCRDSDVGDKQSDGLNKEQFVTDTVGKKYEKENEVSESEGNHKEQVLAYGMNRKTRHEKGAVSESLEVRERDSLLSTVDKMLAPASGERHEEEKEGKKNSTNRTGGNFGNQTELNQEGLGHQASILAPEVKSTKRTIGKSRREQATINERVARNDRGEKLKEMKSLQLSFAEQQRYINAPRMPSEWTKLFLLKNSITLITCLDNDLSQSDLNCQNLFEKSEKLKSKNDTLEKEHAQERQCWYRERENLCAKKNEALIYEQNKEIEQLQVDRNKYKEKYENTLSILEDQEQLHNGKTKKLKAELEQKNITIKNLKESINVFRGVVPNPLRQRYQYHPPKSRDCYLSTSSFYCNSPTPSSASDNDSPGSGSKRTESKPAQSITPQKRIRLMFDGSDHSGGQESQVLTSEPPRSCQPGASSGTKKINKKENHHNVGKQLGQGTKDPDLQELPPGSQQAPLGNVWRPW